MSHGPHSAVCVACSPLGLDKGENVSNIPQLVFTEPNYAPRPTPKPVVRETVKDSRAKVANEWGIPLTERENEIISLYVEGLTSNGIGKRLGINRSVVHQCIANVRGQLQFSSSHELREYLTSKMASRAVKGEGFQPTHSVRIYQGESEKVRILTDRVDRVKYGFPHGAAYAQFADGSTRWIHFGLYDYVGITEIG